MNRPKGLEYIFLTNTLLGVLFFALSLLFFAGTASGVIGSGPAGLLVLVGLILLLAGRKGLLVDFTHPGARRFSVAWLAYGLAFVMVCVVGQLGGSASAMPAMLFFVIAGLMVVSANLLMSGRKSGWLLSILVAAFWMLMAVSVILASSLSSTTGGLEGVGLAFGTAFFLPGAAMIYYLLRPHVRQYFQ